MLIRRFAIFSATAALYGAAVFGGAAHAQSPTPVQTLNPPELTTNQSVIATGSTLIAAGGFPYVVSIMDPRFPAVGAPVGVGAYCDVSDFRYLPVSYTTANSNTIRVGSLTPSVGQHIAIPGVGHVSGASDLYVNYGNTATMISTGGMMYAPGNTITMSNGDVLVVDSVSSGSSGPVSSYHVQSYQGSSSTPTTTTQMSASCGTARAVAGHGRDIYQPCRAAALGQSGHG